MPKYKALKNSEFKAGPFNDKRNYNVEVGKTYDIPVRVKQLEIDGVLQLLDKIEVKDK